MLVFESATVDKCTEYLVFACTSVSLIASRGKGAKGVARSGFPPACGVSERRVGILCWRRYFAALALDLPGLDARFRSHGAMPEPVGLVARLHDVAMVSQPVQ